jgi:threonine dehydratase
MVTREAHLSVRLLGSERMMCTTPPDLAAIRAAAAAIRGVAVRTPLVPAPRLSGDVRREVRLKLEITQPTGAFKLRGATNALVSLDKSERSRGVACASTGNHGRAVAYAAARLGVPATVCMSRLVPENKIAAIRALGADVRIVGDSQDEAQAEVDRLVASHGVRDISPFDDPHVIAGQGTIGLEILDDFPETDTIVAPLSGGGLIGGIGCAVKALRQDVRIVGVSQERGPAMKLSLDAGRPVGVLEEPTLADSLGGGIGLSNRFTFDLVRRFVDDVALVSEARIAAAMRRLFLAEGWIAEGGGAIGVALLEPPHHDRLGEHIVVVVSGKNIDPARFLAVIADSR